MPVLPLIAILLVGLAAAAWNMDRRYPNRAVRREAILNELGALPMWVLVLGIPALFVAGLVVVNEPDSFPVLLGLAMLGLAIWFAWVWVREFLFLMARSDDDFPGRFDKLVWGLALLICPPIGLWAFLSYHKQHWLAENSAKPSSMHDLI